MEHKEVTKKKQPLYKKLIGIGIMLAAAVYCIPELQEKILSAFAILKNEWGKQK